MAEEGRLIQLKTKWWKEMNMGEPCPDEESGSSGALELANVGGVFVVLAIGVGFAFVVAIIEFLWHVRKVSIEEQVGYYSVVWAELKFALNVWETKKLTKLTKSSSSKSRAPSEAVQDIIHKAGSFLRLDVFDKISMHKTE